MVVEVFGEATRQDQVIFSGWCKFEKIRIKEFGVMDAVMQKISANIFHVVRVVESVDAVAKFFVDVNHVAAAAATDFDGITTAGVGEKSRKHGVLLIDRPLVALYRR